MRIVLLGFSVRLEARVILEARGLIMLLPAIAETRQCSNSLISVVERAYTNSDAGIFGLLWHSIGLPEWLKGWTRRPQVPSMKIRWINGNRERRDREKSLEAYRFGAGERRRAWARPDRSLSDLSHVERRLGFKCSVHPHLLQESS